MTFGRPGQRLDHKDYRQKEVEMQTASYWSATHSFPAFPAIDRDIEVDVVVVGAGLTGITAAYLLKQEGARVAMIERDRMAAGDTSRTTAHLTYVTDKRLNKLVGTFGHDAAKAFWEAGAAAIDAIAAIARQTQADCGFHWTPGCLHASMRDKDATKRQRLEQDAELARAFGFDATFVEHVPFANSSGVHFPVLSLDNVYEYERAISENAHGTLLMHNTRSASGESHGVHHQLLSEPPMHALW